MVFSLKIYVKFQVQGRKDVPTQLIKGEKPEGISDGDNFESLKPTARTTSDVYSDSLPSQYGMTQNGMSFLSIVVNKLIR